MDVAWSLFLAQGFAGTTVTQIEAGAALAAGSGSFYRHFRSKQDVLCALVDREVERLDADRTFGPDPTEVADDARVALALEFQRRLGSLRRMQPLMALVRREREHLGPSREHLYELLVTRNLGVRSQRLTSWMDAGLIPRRDPEVLTATVMAALTGYQLSVEFFDGPLGEVREDAFIAMLVDLVTARSSNEP
jgi:AcrR family transcriptional regulator